jgi:hypothetical protein
VTAGPFIEFGNAWYSAGAIRRIYPDRIFIAGEMWPSADRLGDEVHGQESATSAGAGAGRATAGEARGVNFPRTKARACARYRGCPHPKGQLGTSSQDR